MDDFDVIVKIRVSDEVDKEDYGSYLFNLLDESLEVTEVEVET